MVYDIYIEMFYCLIKNTYFWCFLSKFYVIINIESDRGLAGLGLWWPANTMRKHRNLMFSVLFASVSSLTFVVGEPFTERDGAFVC